MDKKIPINLFLLLGSLILGFFILNAVVTHCGQCGRASLVAALADEFRIHFLRLPRVVFPCKDYPNESYPYELEPGCKGFFYGRTVRVAKSTIQINSFGIRDKEYSLEKNSSTYRIFILGDSFTFGQGVNNEEAYPEVLEEKLNALYEGTQFEVFNLGVPGLSTDSEYVRLIHYSPYAPNMLILQTCGNDIVECGQLGAQLERLAGETNITPENFYRFAIEYVLTLDRDARCSCIRDYSGKIMGWVDEAGIPLIIFNVAPEEESPCINEKIALGHTLLDSGCCEQNYWLSRMDAHWNKEGHIYAANELLPVVLMLLNNTGETSPQ